MSNILVKMPVKPNRQKVFWNKGGEEAAAPMKLQSWANKVAFSEGLQGEEAVARRDELMRQAVQDPKQFKELQFMSDPIPFDDVATDAEADFALREEELGQATEEGTIPNETQEDIDADKKRFAEGAPEEGASASAPVPTGQRSLDEWMSDEKKTSFDPHPGDVMLKAIRARLGW
tara:strand:- start:3199 stop:3723 length:525 start_codon:yes stop_codon:yes gene_type:complete